MSTSTSKGTGGAAKPLDRNQLAWRAAQDLADGSYVNLGLGIPVLAVAHLPPGRDVFIQSENGILGIGGIAKPAEVDHDLVDAASQRVVLREGAALFDSTLAFSMMRGRHLDLTLLGGYQVSVRGDLANWDPMNPKRGPLVGGAMDLATGAKQVWVLMEHTTKAGEPRLVERCTYPLTAPGCVNRVYTSLAVIDVTAAGFVAREILDGLPLEALQARTGAPIVPAPDCRPLRVPAL